MSRICGIFSPSTPELASEANLARMLRAMEGTPSGQPATYLDGDRGVALGLATLPAFLAPGEDGSEVWLDSGRFVIALNGGLADDTGSTASQALRVARSLEAESERFPTSLDGVYSVAAWDTTARSLVIATDHLGTRPMYYYHDEAHGVLAFASELKALLALSFVPRELDMEAVAYYLRKGFVVPPDTMLRGINRLLPAERLLMDREGSVQRERYWQMPAVEPGPASEEYWAPKLRQELTDAVGRITRKTPEVALFFSGGLDSSALIDCLRHSGVGRTIALTLAYEGVSMPDDADWARQTASEAGVEHHLISVSPRDVTPAVLGSLLRRFDEPVDTLSRGLTMSVLGRAAHERGLASAIDGGHSEAVCGEAINWRRTTASLGAIRPTGPGESLVERIILEQDLVFTQAQVNELMLTPVDATPMLKRLVANATAVLPADGPHNTYYRIRSMMARGSRTGIFNEAISPLHGVEARCGFLDRKLVEFVQAIPAVLRGSEATRPEERRLLHAAFREAMPLINRREIKRSLPALPWWGTFSHLEPLVLSQIERSKTGGIFRPEAIEKLLRKYRRRGSDRDRQRIWSIFVFQSWHDLLIEGHDPFL